MKQGLKKLAIIGALSLPFQQAQAGEWADYDFDYRKMQGELMFSECYTHKMAMSAEDMLQQRGNDETASPENMLMFVFGRYARGVYLEQYRALNKINDVSDPTNPPEDILKNAIAPIYIFHEDFVDNARKFATMVGIDEPAISAQCANNPLSYYPDI